MNQFTLLVIILVVFTYYGGSNVPKVLKDNKELLLGVVVGLVLCSFLGMRLEGVVGAPLKPETEKIVDLYTANRKAAAKKSQSQPQPEPQDTDPKNGNDDCKELTYGKLAKKYTKKECAGNPPFRDRKGIWRNGKCCAQ
jgi:hypothetical protein